MSSALSSAAMLADAVLLQELLLGFSRAFFKVVRHYRCRHLDWNGLPTKKCKARPLKKLGKPFPLSLGLCGAVHGNSRVPAARGRKNTCFMLPFSNLPFRLPFTLTCWPCFLFIAKTRPFKVKSASTLTSFPRVVYILCISVAELSALSKGQLDPPGLLSCSGR